MGKLSKIIFIVCFLSGIIIGQDEFKRVGKSGFGFLKISGTHAKIQFPKC